MCHWLSSSDWFDVQVHCEGQVFNSHRLVLAAVSPFLKNILLSCNSEDTKCTLMLQDFDADAMSSLIYYIYNGEVNIREEKIKPFLDIASALQITVDLNCLSSYLDSPYRDNIYKKYELKNTFLSESEDYARIKSCYNIEDTLLQYSSTRLDANDKRLQYKLLNKCDSSFGNLQSPLKDRQRDIMLRDTFIETYPVDGHVNGTSRGVPTISSERYRTRTSVLLSNTNCNVQSFSDAPKNINKSFSNIRLSPCERNFGQSQSGDNNILNNLKDILVRSQNLKEFWTRLGCLLIESGNINDPVDNLHCNNLFVMNILNELFTRNEMKCRDQLMIDNQNKIQKSFKRVIVLNKALECPWIPRKASNYYKPLHKKIEKDTSLEKQLICDEIDENNNEEKMEISIGNYIQANSHLKNKTSEPWTEETSTALRSLPKNHFICNECKQVFINITLLTKHMKRHTSPRFTCLECGKTFSQPRNFKYHMSVHRGSKEFAATCTVCGKYFNDKGYLSSHMKIHRNRKEYKCSVCPKSFNQRVAYNMHVRIHTGVKPHVCEECGKAFSRKMLLKQHLRTHTGEKPYECSYCEKRFADRSNMSLHLRLHTGVKPFSCTMCPKSFTKKHHLKAHLNFHTGEKPYICPRCNLAFTQSSNMRTHFKRCSVSSKVVIGNV